MTRSGSTRRAFLQTVGVTTAAAAVGGCDSVNDAMRAFLDLPDDDRFQPPHADAVDEIVHVLNRVTWGPRPGDYEAVRASGLDAFLEAQLDPDSLDDRVCRRRVARIESVHEPAAELYEYNENELLRDITNDKLLRAVYSRRQLYEVMVDFWTDHFNIVTTKDDCRWLKVADDRQVIRRHALGTFRDLVRTSATSPAMLIYLDGHENKVVEPDDRPNENYARELLELHTLGVDGGYGQRDVMEIARALSGWTYRNAPFKFKAAQVEFDPKRHDDGEKVVLGTAIPAGGGADDLERVLDIVCAHPSTAQYIAGKLCRRFIADPPPENAVASVAGTFRSSNGDIRATLRTLFAAPAFREHRVNLLKRPFRFVVSALRITGASVKPAPALLERLERMGHAPFQYPTPDGYPIEAEPWLGTMLWRWQFALDLTADRVNGVRMRRDRAPDRFGESGGFAAHVLGRLPTDAERVVLEERDDARGLLLASPAFQRY